MALSRKHQHFTDGLKGDAGPLNVGDAIEHLHAVLVDGAKQFADEDKVCSADNMVSDDESRAQQKEEVVNEASVPADPKELLIMSGAECGKVV